MAYRITRILLEIGVTLVVCGLLCTAVSAQVPHLIRYQGTLVDTTNVPLEGSYSLTFRVYGAEAGGSALWTETQTAIPVSRGTFNVLLGQVSPLTLPFDKDYWLTTQVGTDTEMSPRQRLTSVPYAFRAEEAERLAEQPPHFAVDTTGTLTNSLIAYWKLDEASGTRNDSKGANSLTDHNTVTQAVGKKGNAGQFTAANSKYLSIADNADLSTGDVDFTFSGWFYLDSHPGAGADIALLSKGDCGNGSTCAYWVAARRNGANTQTRLSFTLKGTALDSDDLLSLNTWYFFVAWHDSVNNRQGIRLNAVEQDQAFSAGSIDEGCGFFIGAGNASGLGCGGGIGSFMNGRIDEVGFWKRVLTAQERADLYTGGQGDTYLPGGFYVDSFLTGKRYRLMMEEVP